jgi:ketosteroid isomerase-like protein
MRDHTPKPGSALNVALEFHRAWTGGAVDKALELVAADVVCDSPSGRLSGIEAYRPFLAKFQPLVSGYDLIASLGDMETAVLVYDLHTAPVRSAVTCECVTVRDGKITQIRLIFDPTPFAAAATVPSSTPSAGQS